MKKLTLLLSVVFAVAIALTITIPALAADSDTTTVSGSIPTSIDVTTAPSWVFIGILTPGTPTESTNKRVTVKCNKAGWILTAEDKGPSLKTGHMQDDDTTYSLVNPLEIKGNGKEYAYLNSSVTLVNAGGVGITNISDVRFRQTADWTDAVDGYSITVTFTATTL